MLDEIRTLVVISETGSLQNAAGRLHLTPSAVTRQVQRLEAALGTPLLDRRTKPPSLTATGRAVLERSRGIIRSFDDLKASVSGSSEPTGPFRVGLAHALAEPGIVGAVGRLVGRLPGVRPVFASDLTPNLIDRVRSGDLDAAAILLPGGSPVPADLTGAIVSTQPLTLVAPRSDGRSGRRPVSALAGRRWVLNPPGCLVRDALGKALAASGIELAVTAEVHDLALQFSMVAAGLGLGLLPTRFVATHPRRAELCRWQVPGIDLGISVGAIRGAALGQLEAAADAFEEELAAHFGRAFGTGR